MTVKWPLETPSGLAQLHHYPVARGRVRASLVLGHGAGRGVDAPDLVAIATALPSEGIEVILVEQPWHVRGMRVASAPKTLDAAWIAALADLRTRGIGLRRLVAGGRSAGARVACRTVDSVAPDAVLCLAFPLHGIRRVGMSHPPSRIDELAAAAAVVPTVVVQGTRDAMGRPDEIADALAQAGATARVVPVAQADHGFAVPARDPGGREAALAMVVRVARATSLKLVAGPY